jgi:hypothetical protein
MEQIKELHNKIGIEQLKSNQPKFYYFYNPAQVDFFFKNGINGIGAGKGKLGDFYIQFPINTESEKVFDRWCKLCEESKR